MTERQQFQSTALMDGTYDRETQELTVTFRNGGSYTMTGVPPDLWEGLCAASSPGSFFHQNIRGRY